MPCRKLMNAWKNSTKTKACSVVYLRDLKNWTPCYPVCKNQKYVNLKDALPEAYERMEKLHENKGMLRGLPTGFKELDTMLSGLQKSKVRKLERCLAGSL